MQKKDAKYFQQYLLSRGAREKQREIKGDTDKERDTETDREFSTVFTFEQEKEREREID